MLEEINDLYDVINVVNETLSGGLDHAKMKLDELESKQENDIGIFCFYHLVKMYVLNSNSKGGIANFSCLKRLVYSRVDIHLGD